MPKKTLGSNPYLFPMPLVLVGAMVNGKPNFMPAAFVGIVNFKPAMLGCGLSPAHATSKGIEEHKAFSVNIPSEDLMVKVDYCGLTSGAKEDKSRLFKVFYGATKDAPLVEDCPICIECQLVQSLPLGLDTLYIGHINEIHCEAAAMTDGQPDLLKIKPFVFTFPDKGFFSIGKKIGTGWNSGRSYRPFTS
jgi:flavin reductase (DIM6/NTAB) family NADH-FMN oxidoreductase RutF